MNVLGTSMLSLVRQSECDVCERSICSSAGLTNGPPNTTDACPGDSCRGTTCKASSGVVVVVAVCAVATVVVAAKMASSAITLLVLGPVNPIGGTPRFGFPVNYTNGTAPG